jgi:hypothetical protein
MIFLSATENKSKIYRWCTAIEPGRAAAKIQDVIHYVGHISGLLGTIASRKQVINMGEIGREGSQRKAETHGRSVPFRALTPRKSVDWPHFYVGSTMPTEFTIEMFSSHIVYLLSYV